MATERLISALETAPSPIISSLERVEALQAALAKLETTTAGHRQGIERAERLITELSKATADTMAAREVPTARREGEQPPARSRSWWRRIVG
jgi:hypothetical protein